MFFNLASNCLRSRKLYKSSSEAQKMVSNFLTFRFQHFSFVCQFSLVATFVCKLQLTYFLYFHQAFRLGMVLLVLNASYILSFILFVNFQILFLGLQATLADSFLAYLDELSNVNKFQVSKGFLLLRVNEVITMLVVM